MHLRCPRTAAMTVADPPAPMEHIGGERAHARGLPAMLQLCSPSMSRPAQIKDQLELDDDSRLKNGGYSCTRTCGGRATVSTDQLDQCLRALQVVLRVGGSNHQDPVGVALCASIVRPTLVQSEDKAASLVLGLVILVL